MPKHHHAAVSGTITHIFAHRFVIETATGSILADLTPDGIIEIALQVGTSVVAEGEMKPSELKVTRLTCNGKTIHVRHRKKNHKNNDPSAHASIALAAVVEAGFQTVGEPRRKGRHFEVLSTRSGELTELHIEFDGRIRKSEPVTSDDRKWAEALSDYLISPASGK